jgi:chemotaxis protein CheZ
MDAAVKENEEDLDALFDRISNERASVADTMAEAPTAAVGPAQAEGEPDVFHRIGSLARTLHDTLRELGYDKEVGRALQSLPDARERLSYIANLTGQAAERTLTAVEQGKSVSDTLHGDVDRLSAEWKKLYAGELDVEAFKALAGRTRDFFGGFSAHGERINACLLEIMMAQDFHDLTGQVIQRIVKVAQNLEDQLLKLLLDTAPADRRCGVEEKWLNGPAVGAQSEGVVANQAQVDQLLESLGF